MSMHTVGLTCDDCRSWVNTPDLAAEHEREFPGHWMQYSNSTKVITQMEVDDLDYWLRRPLAALPHLPF